MQDLLQLDSLMLRLTMKSRATAQSLKPVKQYQYTDFYYAHSNLAPAIWEADRILCTRSNERLGTDSTDSSLDM